MSPETGKTLVDRDRRLMWHPFTQMKTAGSHVPIVESYAATLVDDQGKEYIDAIGCWWTNLHGHAHPHLANCIANQAKSLPHVMFAGFTHEPAVSLCERLGRWLPKQLSKFFFSDNGSSSTEIALKMALRTKQLKRGAGDDTEKPLKVIAFRDSYHGDTFGAMAVGERDVFVKPFVPYLFDVEFIPAPTPGNEKQSRKALRRALEKHDVAAFIFEPLIQAAGGMKFHEPQALDALLEICRQNDVYTIADEVMTGFFKTGTCFATHQLKTPIDFICLSKALTSGTLPLALTVTTEEVFQAFYSDETSRAFFHGHSYTANPIGCAAALASLDLIESPGFKRNLKRVMEYLEGVAGQYETEIAAGRSPFSEVRQKGIVLALDVKVDQREGYLSKLGPMIYNKMMDAGVLVRPLGEVVYVVPPICISDDQLDFVFQTIDRVVGEIKTAS